MNNAQARKRRLVRLSAGLCLAMLAVAPVRAQEPDGEVLARLEAAFAQGDVETLLSHAADRLDVTVFGANAVYSRAQARYVLEGFFRDHPPQRFHFQEPSRRDENTFAAGQYGYAQAEDPLWVYVRLRRQADRWELREVRIDRKPGG